MSSLYELIWTRQGDFEGPRQKGPQFAVIEPASRERAPPAHPREVGVPERAWLTEGVAMGGAGGGGGADGAVRC